MFAPRCSDLQTEAPNVIADNDVGGSGHFRLAAKHRVSHVNQSAVSLTFSCMWLRIANRSEDWIIFGNIRGCIVLWLVKHRPSVMQRPLTKRLAMILPNRQRCSRGSSSAPQSASVRH